MQSISIQSNIIWRFKKNKRPWKFILQDNQDFKNESFNDDTWQTINVPYDWSIKGQLSPALASCKGYLPGEIAWYRKDIDIPSERKGQNVFLYFEGVYNRSEVYVNGNLLGKRPNGYISFAYDATSYIKYGEKNTIAVRVDHSKSADSRWYTGSGIYRNVWLVYANPIHIAQWGVYVYPELNKNSGVLNIEVDLENGLDDKLQKTGIVYHPQRIKVSIVRRVKVNHLQRTKVNH